MVADLLAKTGPSAETVDAGRRRLRQADTTRRPRRGMLFGGLGGFLTLVSGVAAAAVFMTGGGEQVLVKPHDPASALQTAAERAETASWGSGKYWYVKSRYTLARNRDSPPDMDGTGEAWTTRDGRMWLRSISPPDKLRKAPGKNRLNVCGKKVSYREIQDLPTEPNALRAELRRMRPDDQGGPKPPEYGEHLLTSCMIDLLLEQFAPPKIRAAVLRSLAGLPEAEELGTVRDNAGREGTALAITNGENRHELIIDPATSAVLQWEGFQTLGDQTMLQIRTFYKAGWTDTPPS
ncbi:hypothetical protein GCM10010439_04430 [Actinocorallia aurantiaca]|uniref:CU044_5270 family protein n=2 Tax=Actinocorallia aurantiaca TaxID=46204 RepID=A0ABN3TVG0_9ACTN